MGHELWPLLYHHLREVAPGFSPKYVPFQPWVLVAAFLWAALHDRPVAWACRPRNGSTTRLRSTRLPSPATLSRRSDGTGVGLSWCRLKRRLRGAGHPALVALLDGKPLVISGVSKDPDAGYGRAAGGKATGYKRTWVWAKLLINAARILKHDGSRPREKQGLTSPLKNVGQRGGAAARQQVTASNLDGRQGAEHDTFVRLAGFRGEGPVTAPAGGGRRRWCRRPRGCRGGCCRRRR
jgi:hypothetical protein